MLEKLIPSQRWTYYRFLRRHRAACRVSDYEQLRDAAVAADGVFAGLRTFLFWLSRPWTFAEVQWRLWGCRGRSPLR